MKTQPVNLAAALDSFDEVYDPRVLALVNDYTVRIAHTLGEHVWHTHEETDEFFLVLRGRFSIALRSPDGTQESVELAAGDVFVVPKGMEHKPSSSGGSILMFEPATTVSTGTVNTEDIPANVTSSTGRLLAVSPSLQADHRRQPECE
jgi:mannose-6-phosphate isomerase-like protein (cupin superfamily)